MGSLGLSAAVAVKPVTNVGRPLESDEEKRREEKSLMGELVRVKAVGCLE